jgi:hypothetical protein
VGGETVSLFTDTQRVFRSEEERRANLDGAVTFRWYALEDTGVEHSVPAPVRFVFEDDEEGNHYIVLVSEWEDLREPHAVFTEEKEALLYNLKAGWRYYWCVQKDGVRSPVSSFVTAPDFPRCVKIDGVSNVRDFGGYYVDGGRIRQGLLYRGSEFEIHTHLSTEGANELRALGIRTDLDLRGEAKGKVLYPTSALFGMKYVLLPAVPYGEVYKKEHKANTKRFFMLLAKKSAYPIYFHCWGGADRTGTLAFLLGAFLGMKKEDLIYEYEFTSLSRWGTRTRNHPPFMAFVEAFEAYEGATYPEKATAFLRDGLGLSEETLARIKEIFIE